MHICSNKGFKIKQTYNMEEYHLVIMLIYWNVSLKDQFSVKDKASMKIGCCNFQKFIKFKNEFSSSLQIILNTM